MKVIAPDIVYHPNWPCLKQQPNLFDDLCTSIDWQDEHIKIFGKIIKCPRKVSWYGDTGINYSYSGNVHQTTPWHPVLKNIKDEIEFFTKHKFNFALLNFYRNGNNYMGWHSDNEASLGQHPFIASISLGATRTMKFKHKKLKFDHSILLEDSSLLIMKGDTQEQWLHTIPKQPRENNSRINITFRYILNTLGNSKTRQILSSTKDQ